MKSLARLLILFIAFVALPLRSVAAVSGGPCAAMHGAGQQVVQGLQGGHAALGAQAHGGHPVHAPVEAHAGHGHGAHEAYGAYGHGAHAGAGPAGVTGDEDSAAGRCSLCAAHCGGVSFVPVVQRTLDLAAGGSDRIDFLGRQPAGHVPDILDRPPQSHTGS
jgi:hypothetical protein